jgi:hypothetical protein
MNFYRNKSKDREATAAAVQKVIKETSLPVFNV